MNIKFGFLYKFTYHFIYCDEQGGFDTKWVFLCHYSFPHGVKSCKITLVSRTELKKSLEGPQALEPKASRKKIYRPFTSLKDQI